MNSYDIINKAEQFVKEQLKNDSSGHDWGHVNRVRKMAVKIARKEGANEFICEITSLLHDVADEKLNSSKGEGIKKVNDWLKTNIFDAHTINQVLSIISTMSYNGGYNPPMKTEVISEVYIRSYESTDIIEVTGLMEELGYPTEVDKMASRKNRLYKYRFPLYKDA